ncbi:MAG: T9SS type A sorting domain-containing protein, partial [Bacteroidales bacterium]|nr:T9SS type A sorting domain-containing protein [Bacteroidales bacterium]
SQHTTIHFTLKKNSMVRLSIVNMNGQVIATLLDQKMSSGEHQFIWNAASHGKKLARGLYFYRLEVDGKNYFNKLIVQ